MAKKRGVISPIGHAEGSEQAVKDNALSDIEHNMKQLKGQAKSLNLPLEKLLEKHFGLSNISESQVWKLKSGKEVIFREFSLSYEQVKANTSVTFEVNGRDQDALTKESLKELDSMKYHQFYPAIGRRVNDTIDILDGSRRRAKFLLEAGAIEFFKILVTDDDISKEDAKTLANDLQVAKEHNLREIGLGILNTIKDIERKSSRTPKQDELAKIHNISQSKVSRAIKAASIETCLIKLFPDISLLSHGDYNTLDKIQKSLKGMPAQELVELIEDDVVDYESFSNLDEHKDHVIGLLKETISAENSNAKKPVVTDLAKFDNKHSYARRKVSNKKTSFEFNRVPAETLKQIELAINQVLNGTLK